MAATTVSLDRYTYDYSIVVRRSAHVDLGDGTWLVAYEPKVLEQLAEKLLEAARDLSIAQLDALEERSLSAEDAAA